MNFKQSLMLVGIVSIVSLSIGTIHAQQEPIPKWVKLMTIEWTQNTTSDQEFLSAVKYLVENNIIKIDGSTYMSTQEHQKQLDEQLKKHVLEKVKEGKEWETLSNEYEQKIKDLKKSHDEKLKIKKDDYKATIKERNDIIKELETKNLEQELQIKDLKKQLK